MTRFKSLITLLCIPLIIASCDKDEDPVMCNTTSEPEDKSVMIQFNMNEGENTFSYDTVYELNGVSVEFSELRFYVSDIMLHDDAGNSEMMTQTLLLDAGTAENSFTIGQTSFSHIHELHLLFGLNETVNHEDPTEADAPLNDAGMHWGWNPDMGYKFLKAEFSVDTDGDNVPDTGGAIHCATDALAREFMIAAHQDVEGETAQLTIDVDVMSFFNGVDFLNLEGTHGGSPLTNSVADNVTGSFTIN